MDKNRLVKKVYERVNVTVEERWEDQEGSGWIIMHDCMRERDLTERQADRIVYNYRNT